MYISVICARNIKQAVQTVRAIVFHGVPRELEQHELEGFTTDAAMAATTAPTILTYSIFDVHVVVLRGPGNPGFI